MRLLGRGWLIKHQKKNAGNKKLGVEIVALIRTIESFTGKQDEIKLFRADADKVHEEGF